MKSRKPKLIRVTSSNESQKHKCVDLRDYNIYWNNIGTEHKYHTINTDWMVVSCSNNFNAKLVVVAGWATGAPQKLCGPRK